MALSGTARSAAVGGLFQRCWCIHRASGSRAGAHLTVLGTCLKVVPAAKSLESPVRPPGFKAVLAHWELQTSNPYKGMLRFGTARRAEGARRSATGAVGGLFQRSVAFIGPQDLAQAGISRGVSRAKFLKVANQMTFQISRTKALRKLIKKKHSRPFLYNFCSQNVTRIFWQRSKSEQITPNLGKIFQKRSKISFFEGNFCIWSIFFDER